MYFSFGLASNMSVYSKAFMLNGVEPISSAHVFCVHVSLSLSLVLACSNKVRLYLDQTFDYNPKNASGYCYRRWLDENSLQLHSILCYFICLKTIFFMLTFHGDEIGLAPL